MATWLHALARTRARFSAALNRVLGGSRAADEAALEDLEELLIQADVPVRLADELLAALQEAPPGSDLHALLRAHLVEALGPVTGMNWDRPGKPLTVLLVGVNGSGKTTTCARLARLVQQAGLAPLLGASDTFRAAGTEQLRWWAEHLQVEVVAGRQGADAAAVAFDAMDAAVARKQDVLLLDTAGRMHTKQPLMHEMQKIRRALSKQDPDKPEETWLVLDASMGQNAVTQARVFHEATPLTGVVVTKLDGSAKAGFIFAIARDLGVPLRYVGLGEGADDLAAFDPAAFVDALLGSPAEAEGETTGT